MSTLQAAHRTVQPTFVLNRASSRIRVSHGEITVRRCPFSDVYSVEVCRLVGALDSGLLAGLSGGDRLEFTQRITEGAPCCLARLRSLPAREAAGAKVRRTVRRRAG
jgi:hypothetical protein